MSQPYPVMSSSRMVTQNNVSVATTSTSSASNAFGSQTYQIRIAAPNACYYKVDSGSPTATVSDVFLPNTWVDYVKVSPGQKIAVFSPTIQVISVQEVTN